MLNSILWILITGSRWCDLPNGPQWASKSSSHRWLETWRECGALKKAFNNFLLLFVFHLKKIAINIEIKKLLTSYYLVYFKCIMKNLYDLSYKIKNVTILTIN